MDYETNILIEDGRAYFKADGTVRMFAKLGFPWSMMRGLRILPTAVQDWLYELLARNRLRLFGRSNQCFVPTPEIRERFLDGE